MTTRAIEVRIWGQRVGALAADPALGCYAFEYESKWLKTGIELAPQTMPVGSSARSYGFPSLPTATYHGLPGMVSDALPDDFGNALITAWMQSKGFAKESITPLDRLAYMGKRGLGALEFRPSLGTRKDSSQVLEMQSLVEAARHAVQGTLVPDKMAAAALAQIIRVGASAGGARAKAVIAWNPKTDAICSGQFEVPPGFEYWLLKLDGVGKDLELGMGAHYGRIEFAYSLMARAAGIQMSDCRLLKEHGRAHFMTRRFDRDGHEKHHVQTLCAMEHLDYKQRATHTYAQAFMTVARLKLGVHATDELFRRMAFNVMARNCDDHTKNLTFLLKQNEPWVLAPAYDLTYAYNPQGEWTYQHLMSVNGKFSEITRADLLTEADRFGVRNAKAILREVADALADFGQFADRAELPALEVHRIRKHLMLL